MHCAVTLSNRQSCIEEIDERTAFAEMTTHIKAQNATHAQPQRTMKRRTINRHKWRVLLNDITYAASVCVRVKLIKSLSINAAAGQYQTVNFESETAAKISVLSFHIAVSTI
jgi:hypothetical protein